jgi:hypothetical protein
MAREKNRALEIFIFLASQPNSFSGQDCSPETISRQEAQELIRLNRAGETQVTG